MAKIRFSEVLKGSPLLNDVEKLFIECYAYFSTKGLLMPLSEDGGRIWRSSIEKTIGKYSVLIVAIQNEEIVAFAHGSLRFAPEFMGAKKVGVVNYIYVNPELRNQNIGFELYTRVENWFKERQVHSCELQVLVLNTSAINFWQSMGFNKELLQMRKMLAG